MTDVPIDKMRTQAMAGNPIIAQAQKEVPGGWRKRWDNTRVWVRHHRKTIFLTLETLGGLAMAYWYYMRGLQKIHAKQLKLATEVKELQTKQTEQIVTALEIGQGLVSQTAKQQIALTADQEILKGRMKIIEEVLNDPRFAGYLSRQQGISDLKPVPPPPQ